MSSTLPTSSKSPALTSTTEPKPRGANRSTKVAGKLKVLPEQPQSSVTSRDKPTVAPIAPKSPSEFESPGTTADSDEDEADDEEDVEDMEVCRGSPRYYFSAWASHWLTQMRNTVLQSDRPYTRRDC